MKLFLLPLFICASIFLTGCLEDEKTPSESPTIDVTVNINGDSSNDKKEEPSSREALRNVYAK